MESRNTVCFEGISRVYRNAVVKHIRLRFKSKYPDTWLDELTSPFRKEEWDNIQSSARIPRNTGELESELEDEFDLLSVNHFYNLFDKYFEVLFTINISNETEHRQQKQAILQWTRTIKRLRDPVLGHPAEADITGPDAYMMLDSARRILRFIDCDAAKLLENLRDKSDDKEIRDLSLYDERRIEGGTLPSRELIAPRFVGRKHELDSLLNWFKDPDSRIWLLAGDGGKGKTSIAYQFATSIRDQAPKDLEIVIWMSAKAHRFLSGKVVDIESPDFYDLNSALDQVLFAYDAIELNEDMNVREKKEVCLNYLRELPALVILDDIDSLEGRNREAMTFFTRDAYGVTSSKILLTSRRILFGFEPTVTQISGLEELDGLKFIGSRIEMHKLDSSLFTNKTMKKIHRVCDGSPLFMEDLLRLVKVGETPTKAVELWSKQTGQAAREYALKREFELLSDKAQRVLLSCALFNGAVALTDISVAVSIAEEELHSSIEELQDLFLVSKPHIIEDIPRFELKQNTRKLVIDIMKGTDLYHRLSKIIEEITVRPLKSRRKQNAISGYINQARSCVRLGRYKDAESTLLRALDYHPENSDLHGFLGWVYKSWQPRQRYTDATKAFTRAADLQSSKRDMYWHWCQMELKRKEWTSAITIAERGLECLVSSVPVPLLWVSGYAHSRLAKEMYQQIQYGRAEQGVRTAKLRLDKALRIFSKNDYLKTEMLSFYRNTFRATILNIELDILIKEAQQDSRFLHSDLRRIDRELRVLAQLLDRWLNECPDDPDAYTERQRLIQMFPTIRTHLKASA